jgi:hypothetical protein
MIDFVYLFRYVCMFSRCFRDTLYLNMLKILDAKPIRFFKTIRVEVRINEIIVDPVRAQSQPRHAVLHKMARRAKTAFHVSAKTSHHPSNATSAGSAAHASIKHH